MQKSASKRKLTRQENNHHRKSASVLPINKPSEKHTKNLAKVSSKSFLTQNQRSNQASPTRKPAVPKQKQSKVEAIEEYKSKNTQSQAILNKPKVVKKLTKPKNDKINVSKSLKTDIDFTEIRNAIDDTTPRNKKQTGELSFRSPPHE